MEYATLNNGVRMPRVGYGVYQVSSEECEHCVLDALDVGYRAIDTATVEILTTMGKTRQV